MYSRYYCNCNKISGQASSQASSRASCQNWSMFRPEFAGALSTGVFYSSHSDRLRLQVQTSLFPPNYSGLASKAMWTHDDGLAGPSPINASERFSCLLRLLRVITISVRVSRIRPLKVSIENWCMCALSSPSGRLCASLAGRLAHLVVRMVINESQSWHLTLRCDRP